MKRILFGAIAGALIAFIWSTFSYMVLPWHNLGYGWFKDGEAVSRVLVEQMDQDGIYLVPNLPPMSEHDNAETQMQWQDDAKRGPFVYMWIMRGGLQFNMAGSMVIQFLIQLAVGLIAAFLLAKSTFTTWLGRAAGVSVLVFSGSFLTLVPFWNWFGFPVLSTVVTLADYLIAWFLAGLAMAKVVPSASRKLSHD